MKLKSSPIGMMSQLVRKQTVTLNVCMTRGSTDTLEIDLMGTPKDPHARAADTAANHPHASVHCPMNTILSSHSQDAGNQIYDS